MLFLLLVSKLFAYNPYCAFTNASNPAAGLLSGINDISMYFSNSEAHPFADVCSDSAKINTARQSIYDFSLAPQDADGNKTQKFFSLLKNRIKETIAYQKDRALEEKKCIQTAGGTVDSCIEVSPVISRMLKVEKNDDSKAESENSDGEDFLFSRLVTEARFNLSLSQSPARLMNIMNGGAKSDLNTQLTSYGTHKAVDWMPMRSDSDEFSNARDYLTYYHAEGVEITKNMPTYTGGQQRKIRQAQKENMAAHRIAHLATYQMIMSAHPVLQYIKSPKPDSAEVSGAIDSVLESIEKEEKWLNGKTDGLEAGDLDTSLLSLLNYSGEVMGVLSENPEYCSLVKDWVTLRDAKNLGFDMSAGLLVMGASFLFPPAFAVTGPLLLGVGAGAGYVAYDKMRTRSTQFQIEGRMKGKADPALLRQMSEEEVQRINAFLLSITGVKGVASLKSLPVIRRIFPTKLPSAPPASK